ncbi:MAG: 50S ribosomal protein L17 [Nitrospirota bacterium]
MRHRVAGKRFHRNTNQRKALLRGLVISLFDHLKIETTVAKAKEAKKVAERIITLGKKGDISSRRLALSRIPNKAAIMKLFVDIAPKIKRSSGYLRVLKTRNRVGDNASMAILEFVDYDLLNEEKAEKPEKEEKKEKKEKKAKAKTEEKKEEKKEKKATKAKKEEKKETKKEKEKK